MYVGRSAQKQKYMYTTLNTLLRDMCINEHCTCKYMDNLLQTV